MILYIRMYVPIMSYMLVLAYTYVVVKFICLILLVNITFNDRF